MRIVAISTEIPDPMVIDFSQVELMYAVAGYETEKGFIWPALVFELRSGRVVYVGPFRTTEKANEMIGVILNGYREGSAVLSMEI